MWIQRGILASNKAWLHGGIWGSSIHLHIVNLSLVDLLWNYKAWRITNGILMVLAFLSRLFLLPYFLYMHNSEWDVVSVGAKHSGDERSSRERATVHCRLVWWWLIGHVKVFQWGCGKSEREDEREAWVFLFFCFNFV